ncbi:hypothetical protein Tco_1042369 [Tanacetum coccineum]|uniref:Uncharacterized protein n=1 Tax=Tanacetum coccineum TaxID=301880 RepID=A0ABQ5GK05_9ASTR
MKNFLKSDIVWESKDKKFFVFTSTERKTTPLVHSCQRDPKAPALSLINQDLLYLKRGNYGPKKIVLSLHKFPAIIFNDDDIEERTSRWVNKCVKKFNPYPRYDRFISLLPTMTFPEFQDHERSVSSMSRVLEGLKSYNNDVKYGYVQKDLTKDETEYLKLFKEEIDRKMKHRRPDERWRSYTDSDYAGASMYRKSTTGGCQFLGSRLIS